MYNAYFTIYDAGKVLSARELDQVAGSVNLHVGERANLGYARTDGRARRGTHLGIRVLRIEARYAEDARANVDEARRFIRVAGYRWREELTRATAEAVSRMVAR